MGVKIVGTAVGGGVADGGTVGGTVGTSVLVGTGVLVGGMTGVGGAAITESVEGMQVAVVTLPAIHAKPPLPPAN